MVFRIVGIAALPLERMIPISHQLSGSGSHTTSIAMAARTTFTLGAEIVVRIVLIPFGLDDILIFPSATTRHHSARLLQHFPVGCHRGFNRRRLSGIRHSLTNAFKIVGQSRCYVVNVKDALVGITDDGAIMVVGSHDDEPSVAYVEDIITRLFPFGKRSIHQVQFRVLSSRFKFGHHK